MFSLMNPQDHPMHETASKLLSVKPTERDRSYWLGQEYVAPDLRTALQDVSVLLIPHEGFRDRDEPLFPVGTESFVSFLRTHGDSLTVDLCIDDDKYYELALHADLIITPCLLVKFVVAPIVVAMTARWIYDKLAGRKGRVRFEMTIDTGLGRKRRQQHIKYDGPDTTFEATVMAAVDRVQVLVDSDQTDGPEKL